MFDGCRILVTGSTGFIGSNLARHFALRKAEVHTILRRSSNQWRIDGAPGQIYNHVVDLSDYVGLKETVSKVRPDFIIHTATYGGHSFQRDEDTIYNSNFTGTMNLVKACKDIDYKAFINTGSSSEYGSKDKRMEEGDQADPNSDYGISKAAATMYCRTVAKRDKKPIVTLRLFSPFGYYDDPNRLIPTVILSGIAGKPPLLASRAFVRDFIFIEDIVDAYEKTIGSDAIAGEVLNIGSGHQSSIGEVADLIVSMTGNKVVPIWGNTPKRDNEPSMWEASISKAQSLIGWQPKFSLEKGLKKTVEWFTANRSLYEHERTI